VVIEAAAAVAAATTLAVCLLIKTIQCGSHLSGIELVPVATNDDHKAAESPF
jgi:hypothetical protein